MNLEGRRVCLLKEQRHKGSLLPRGTQGHIAEVYPDAAALDLLIADQRLVGGHRIVNVVVPNDAFALYADAFAEPEFATETTSSPTGALAGEPADCLV